MQVKDNEKLTFHLGEVRAGNRRFENAAQSVSRMILERGVEKTIRAGQTAYEFKFFREGQKHMIGLHQEINQLFNFVEDAAKGGSAKERAFVIIGEPGNGKTFFVDYICSRYHVFIARPENRRYTVEFVNVDQLTMLSYVAEIRLEQLENFALQLEKREASEALDELKELFLAERWEGLEQLEKLEPQEKFEQLKSRFRMELNRLRLNLSTKKYGDISVIQSQTFEDPLILAMNLFESPDENKEHIARLGFTDPQIEQFYSNYRPLGACTTQIWKDIRHYCDGDMARMLKFIRVVPSPLDSSLGTLTGKYSARDKITSSADDLLGKRDTTRILRLADTSNPFVYNVRKGALARVAGGGIHFSDEIFRNKKDLVQIYLQVVQNREIELDGYKWPIDCVIIGTSNNDVYKEFVADRQEAPVKDRCQLCYFSHITHYKQQRELTRYAIGEEQKVTVTGENLHEDPNLNSALSDAMTLTRLPHSDKLSPIEMMKLEAGESAGAKNITTLVEVKGQLNKNQDVTKRWGQTGIGQRGVGRTFNNILAMPETHEGKCLFARDCFNAIEQEINDYVAEAIDRDKFLRDIAVARTLYRREIKTAIFNAFRNDPDAIRKDVMNYVNMVIGIGSDQLGPDDTWRYRDPQTDEMKPLKIDRRFIDAVEARMGRTTKETKESFRGTIRKTYAERASTNPNWDFMDNETLVKAVTDVKLESDVAGAASLVGVLSNPTNEENKQIRNNMIETMLGKLGYCQTCAEKTIEYYLEKVDES